MEKNNLKVLFKTTESYQNSKWINLTCRNLNFHKPIFKIKQIKYALFC